MYIDVKQSLFEPYRGHSVVHSFFFFFDLITSIIHKNETHSCLIICDVVAIHNEAQIRANKCERDGLLILIE